MTDLEKIAYTKGFIDKLANGINPLDDTPIPEGDLCNQVRLSRCFFYVSDILRQVVEQGGIQPPPVRPRRADKAPFSLTAEEAAGFAFSETPIGITELTKRLNALADTERVKPLHYRSIITFLLRVGMLEAAEGRYGSASRCPSEEGKRIGITIEQRHGPNGLYFTLLYGREAQSFILDHIAAIVAL